MSFQGPPSASGTPPSMGPGARPIQPGDSSPGSIIKEVSEIRSRYTMSVEPSILNIGYEIGGKPRSYRLPFEAMPLGSTTRWLLYGGPGRSRVSGTFLIDSVRGAENMAGRILNQREAEGFALHSSKRILYSFAGTVTAFAGGYSLAWMGRKDMKFPFMTPKPLERYNNFPNRYLPILKGSYARIMWQITRGNIYAGIGLLLAGPLFGAMGDSSMMVGLYRDDRTKDVVMSMKGNFDRINSNRARAGKRGASSTQPQTQQDDNVEYEEPEAQDSYRTSSNESPSGYGDSRNYSNENVFSDSTSDSSSMESQSKSASTASSTYSSQRGMSPNSQSQSPTRSSSKGFYFDDDDDASPTAGNDPDMGTPAPYQSSGSAWDRVRKGISSQNKNSTNDDGNTSIQTSRLPKASREGQVDPYQTRGDSFSFSKGDEDRQLAKEQAQKEFDEMLERERRESGSNEYNKTMNSVGAGRESPSSSVWDRIRKRD